MTESAITTSFSFPKIEFLNSKLDEVIKLWARGFGQGSFYFTVNDGTPTRMVSFWSKRMNLDQALLNLVPFNNLAITSSNIKRTIVNMDLPNRPKIVLEQEHTKKS
jgi:hypothetical protein